MIRERRGPNAAPLVKLSTAMFLTAGALNIIVGGVALAVGDPWSVFPAVTAGLAFLVMTRHLRFMYRVGWQWGRRELIDSMDEAQRRGLSSREWLMAEIERTELGAVIFTAKKDDE